MGRLQPQQSATDHHRIAALVGRGDHRFDIVQIAEGYHAIQIGTRHRDDERIGSGRDKQAIVRFDATRAADHGFGLAVDMVDRVARYQRDGIVIVPVLTVDDDLVEGLLACQHGREHDAVVIDPRFGAEDGDSEATRIAGQHFFDRAAAGHAVADHDQSFPCANGRLE